MDEFFDQEIEQIQQEVVFYLTNFGHKTRQISKKQSDSSGAIRSAYQRVKLIKTGETIGSVEENETIANVLVKYQEIMGMQDEQIESVVQLKDILKKSIAKFGTFDEPQQESLYCYCGKGTAETNMICCEYTNCVIKWYHMECVGCSEEDARPEKNWVCQRCLFEELQNTYKVEMENQKAINNSTVDASRDFTMSQLDDVSKFTEEEPQQLIPKKRRIVDSEAEDTISK
eukprot:NODE_160_length_15021_cov_0.894786.p6 type:complete len:229 gc:universal NODE_160_length_15021_cov_0.894786:3902-4588(+)